MVVVAQNFFSGRGGEVQRVSGNMDCISPSVGLGPQRAGQATWLGPDEGALMGTLRPPGSV